MPRSALVEGTPVAEEVIDPRVLGRVLRASRIAAGYDTVTDACEALNEAADMKVTERMLGSLERGETTLSFEMAVVFTCVFLEDDGFWPLLKAVEKDWRERFLIASTRHGIPRVL